MTKTTPFEKALKIIKENRVFRVAESQYKVVGSTGNYDVFFDKSKVSCNCQYYCLHGCKITKINEKGQETGYTKGSLCSHIMAVILHQGFLWREENGR